MDLDVLFFMVALVVVGAAVAYRFLGPGGKGPGALGTRKRHNSVILDKYRSMEELQEGLRRHGLESSQLVVAIDYTKSNTWTGRNSFADPNLHSLHDTFLNPYQRVISVIGRTLAPFDDDNWIPTFGFGDALTTDKQCFPFFPDRFCHGFEDVLMRYNQITPAIKMSGPTNFAPVIRKAIELVQQSRQFHVLLIIADGQVTNEQETADAIVAASHHALSIIVIGVGDGPFDMMRHFDDRLPRRKFDNFQFVEFNGVADQPDHVFALQALMELPDQYKEICKLGLL